MPAGRLFVPYTELKNVLGYCHTRVHLQRLIERGLFPAPRRLSDNRIAWLYDELVEHANNRPIAVPKPAPPRLSDEQKADRYARKRERLGSAR